MPKIELLIHASSADDQSYSAKLAVQVTGDG